MTIRLRRRGMSNAVTEEVSGTQTPHDVRDARLRLAAEMLALLVAEVRCLPVLQQRQLRTAVQAVRALQAWCADHQEGEDSR